MSSLIDIPAALVALPRPCAPGTGVRLLADDAQPRLSSTSMPTAFAAWRRTAGSTMRGFEIAGQDQGARIAVDGAAYVITTATKQHSTRSGPPTSRPPA